MTGRAFGARAVGPASRRPTVENFGTSPSEEETSEDPGSHRARAGRARSFADPGITVERMLTDNGFGDRSQQRRQPAAASMSHKGLPRVRLPRDLTQSSDILR